MKEVRVTKRFTFEAAHRLLQNNGKCEFLHGHSYKVEFTIQRGIEQGHGGA